MTAATKRLTPPAASRLPSRSRRKPYDRRGRGMRSSLSPEASRRHRPASRWPTQKIRPPFGLGKFRRILDTDELPLVHTFSSRGGTVRRVSRLDAVSGARHSAAGGYLQLTSG